MALPRIHEAGQGHRKPVIRYRGASYPDTILARAYSGRFARGLANRFALERDAQAPQANPEVHRLTRPLRATAIQAGDTNVPNLWAGTGWRQLTAEPAAASPKKLLKPTLDF